MRRIATVLISLAMAGCSATQTKSIMVGKAESLDIRVVGSYQQDEGSPFSASATVPLEGLSPIEAMIQSQTLLGRTTIEVKELTGPMTIEVIGSGIQNGKSYEIKTGTEHILVGEMEAQLEK